ncbi:MAG: phosphoribosylamine--glycine ligase [Alkaliphilus sp.]|nr:phosphoribosylamine--glycine ligase [Alkaliphilus sp. AH-315-G20]PHS33897.1 MAG: phosphoribosylamine--glycine ligase [Alkaliphilus sp.]
MKILVVGSGGREHTLVWKLAQSSHVDEIYCAPGNPGIAEIATCVDINAENVAELVEFSREMKIDLTIVGPEVPLVLGIVDAFRDAKLRIIGPTKQAAELEGSKSYSKHFMNKYNIPTAKFDEINTLEKGKIALGNYSYPVVIKADGLAAGKGVFICNSLSEAEASLETIMKDNAFGDAGSKVVIEEFLEGIETSVLCFIDNNSIIPMVSSQDHKRILDGDKGPNTGGMGTYSPNYVYTKEIERQVEREILLPTLNGIKSEGMDYRGIIFIGLMITKEGPKVLEYNVRLGDPETQVVLPRLETDLVEIFNAMLENKLSKTKIDWNNKAVVCVVLASKGYPEKYEKGKVIEGIKNVDDDILVFHSGTAMKEGKIVTNGGRVLGVTARANTLKEAISKAYRNVEKVKFEGKVFRTDIAKK